MKPGRAVRRDARERARGRVVRGDEQQVQQIVGRHLVVRPQKRRRRAQRHRFARSSPAATGRGRSSRNTVAVITLVMLAIERCVCEFSSQRISLVVGVVDDGGLGAKIGNQQAAGVRLQTRKLFGQLARHGRGAGPRERRPAISRAGRGILRARLGRLSCGAAAAPQAWLLRASAAAGVCAPAGAGAILTSPASARGPIQKNGLFFTWLIRETRE